MEGSFKVNESLNNNNKKSPVFRQGFFIVCDPAGARTQDPLIKSQVLYQLSYEIAIIYLQLSKSDPAGARTQDPLIKSQVLYQLSYEIIVR